MAQKPKKYINGHLNAWLSGDTQSSVAQYNGEFPSGWEFYVTYGLYAPEKFYIAFINNKGDIS